MNVLGLGVFTLASGLKTGNIEVDDNIKENWEKKCKLCDHKTGCKDFLRKEIWVSAQNTVVLPTLRPLADRVKRQNEQSLETALGAHH